MHKSIFLRCFRRSWPPADVYSVQIVDDATASAAQNGTQLWRCRRPLVQRACHVHVSSYESSSIVLDMRRGVVVLHPPKDRNVNSLVPQLLFELWPHRGSQEVSHAETSPLIPCSCAVRFEYGLCSMVLPCNLSPEKPDFFPQNLGFFLTKSAMSNVELIVGAWCMVPFLSRATVGVWPRLWSPKAFTQARRVNTCNLIWWILNPVPCNFVTGVAGQNM